MSHILSDLANWPVRKNKEPILSSTHDAFLYAQLIYHRQDKQDWLTVCRSNAYIQLKAEREKEKPNPQRMMDLSVKAQLFRETLDEVQRINDEGYNSPPSLKH